MQFKEIIGQKENIEHFKNAIAMKKISHAYIISGEKDSGKRMLAEAFAATLLCEKHGEDACMECASCHQIRDYNHPDLLYVTHEKPNTISVDDIREQINNTIDIRPYKSAYKIYLVEEAEKMNAQAQNALLKTIEEPPSYAVILLLTTNADMLLQTILSRCIKIDMKPVDNEAIKTKLMEKYAVPDYQADMSVAFAQGNVGRAILLASSEEFNTLKEAVCRMIHQAKNMEYFEVSQEVKELAVYKDSIEDYLDLIMVWYRDVLLYKASQDTSRLVFKSEVRYIKKQAMQSTYSGIQKIFDAVKTVRQRLQANVNFELTMELLLQTIKEY